MTEDDNLRNIEDNEEIEVIDVTLDEDEIEEIIAHLTDLKESKTNVQFPLASDLDLSVTYSNDDKDNEDSVGTDEGGKL